MKRFAKNSLWVILSIALLAQMSDAAPRGRFAEPTDVDRAMMKYEAIAQKLVAETMKFEAELRSSFLSDEESKGCGSDLEKYLNEIDSYRSDDDLPINMILMVENVLDLMEKYDDELKKNAENEATQHKLSETITRKIASRELNFENETTDESNAINSHCTEAASEESPSDVELDATAEDCIPEDSSKTEEHSGESTSSETTTLGSNEETTLEEEITPDTASEESGFENDSNPKQSSFEKSSSDVESEATAEESNYEDSNNNEEQSGESMPSETTALGWNEGTKSEEEITPETESNPKETSIEESSSQVESEAIIEETNSEDSGINEEQSGESTSSVIITLGSTEGTTSDEEITWEIEVDARSQTSKVSNSPDLEVVKVVAAFEEPIFMSTGGEATAGEYWEATEEVKEEISAVVYSSDVESESKTEGKKSGDSGINEEQSGESMSSVIITLGSTEGTKSDEETTWEIEVDTMSQTSEELAETSNPADLAVVSANEEPIIISTSGEATPGEYWEATEEVREELSSEVHSSDIESEAATEEKKSEHLGINEDQSSESMPSVTATLGSNEGITSDEEITWEIGVDATSQTSEEKAEVSNQADLEVVAVTEEPIIITTGGEATAGEYWEAVEESK